ncbi:MAG: OmpA family protein [Gemmatimonadales bacterium]
MRASARVYAAVFSLALVAAPASAQRLGTIDFGAFAQASYFDRTLGFEQGAGGGGVRLGFFVLPSLELEGEGTFVPTPGPNNVRVNYFPLRARATFNIRTGQHTALLLGAGYVHNEFRRDLDLSDDGVTGLVGVRLGLPGLPAIRLASYLDVIPSPANGDAENLNWGLQAGLSFLFGAGSSGGTDAAADEDDAEQDADMREGEAMPDSAVAAARADSITRAAREDSLRARAAQDSVAAAARAEEQRLGDSVRVVEEQAAARQQTLRDSLQIARQQDSVRLAAMRDSLRLTRNSARMAALRDSISRVALRDSLRTLVTERQSRVTLRGVNFEINKAVLLPVSREILQDVAQSLVSNTDVRVEVQGHSDNTGPRQLNEELSLARAEAVKAFLVENGVTAERMEVRGYAWDEPAASNKTASGRAENRRVELRRTD